MSITDKIKAIRDELRLSQAEIARRLEIEPPSYHRLENRGDKLSIEQLDSIAKALGVTRMYILTWGEQTDDIHAQAGNTDLLKRIDELEDRLKDKQFIIDKLNDDIEHTSRLINLYMKYLKEEVSSYLRVGTLHYIDDTGDAVNVSIKDISEAEHDRLWWDMKDAHSEISDEENELIMKTLFTHKEFAMTAFYFMGTGFIKDKTMVDAYEKYQSNMADELPVFHARKLIDTNSPIAIVLEKAGLLSRIKKV